jgi:hypothetical protein
LGELADPAARVTVPLGDDDITDRQAETGTFAGIELLL